MNLRLEKGFTLIEIIIVMLIVGILGAVAFPSYIEQMNKGRRADGQNELLELAALQERFYSQNGFYTTLNNLIGAATSTSDEGNYLVTVNCAPAANCNPGTRPQFFLLTATRQAGQVNDVRCGDFTYNQSGARGIINQAAGVVAADCW